MNDNQPLVSIIIPCRNEEKFIGKCLDSLIEQDYPKERIEIIIVDGMSEDKTREIIENYTRTHSHVKLLDNPKKITPVAFNLGIKNSKGKIIALKSAHAIYQSNYISKCVEYLEKSGADNVGGIAKILSPKNTLIAKAIAFALSSPFGAGNAYYKTSLPGRPKWVDTVFGGCYKKEVFDKIGLFNESLIRGQDIEFNLRLKKAGGKILLVPDIMSYYYARSNLKDLFINNFKSGSWVIYSSKFIKKPLRLRHYIPLIFISSLITLGLLGIFFRTFFWLFIFLVSLYLFLAVYFSMKIVLKEKDIRYLFLVPVAFAERHISYGLGSIWGLIKLLIPTF